MKVLSKSLWLVFALALVWACGEKEQPVFQQVPATLINPAPGSNIVLMQSEADEVLLFEVSRADFGEAGNITYTLQMDVAGNNFASSTDLGSSTTTSIEVPVADLNAIALEKGLDPGVASAIEMRVKSSIDKNLPDIISDPVALTLTPYSLENPVMYVPGDYQDWNPENDKTVIQSVNRDNIFEGFVHILSGSGEFKVTETPSWDVNYGTEGNNTLVLNGDNLKVEEFGTFRLKVDLNDKTYEIGEKRKWAIIGEAVGGWDTSDVPFMFDKENNVLTVTTDMAAGDYKFRANNAWTHNFGAPAGRTELEQDGPNLTVAAAGNYTVTLDFNVPGKVTYSITKN